MELNMSKKVKKAPLRKKATVITANSIDELGLNKIQAKTITTMYSKEKMSANSIAHVTGIPRRKVMKTLELQKLTTFSPGSYK